MFNTILQFSFSMICTWAGSSILWGASIDILTDVLVDMSVATRLTLDLYIRRLLTESWLADSPTNISVEHPLMMSANSSTIIGGFSVNYWSVIYIHSAKCSWSIDELSLCHWLYWLIYIMVTISTEYRPWHWLLLTRVSVQYWLSFDQVTTSIL